MSEQYPPKTGAHSGLSGSALQGALDELLGGGLLAYAAEARPTDVLMVLSISADEALTGTRKSIAITRQRVCDQCSGSGRDPAAPPCATCDGQQGPTPCARCHGRGHDQRHDCGACTDGRLPEKIEAKAIIPPRSENQQRVRIARKGDEDLDGNFGDLFVVLKVEGTTSAGPYRGLAVGGLGTAPTPASSTSSEPRAAAAVAVGIGVVVLGLLLAVLLARGS